MTTVASTLTRRSFLAGAAASSAALVLAGCSTTRVPPMMEQTFDPYYVRMYAAVTNESYPIPAVDLRQLKPTHFRTEVADPTGERPGTIVVVTAERYLYLVQENGRAIRYGVGIGRDGFTWDGRGEIARKAAWPVWTPPAEMIRRQPELEEFRNGQPPGITNPLGARAMYIHAGGRDTLYRLHGTAEVWSIGGAVSSGCVRLLNQDVIDLYGRVPVGAKILVT
jgi:lipoprotein-anchoring transpeptidase ErfK/SrfK